MIFHPSVGGFTWSRRCINMGDGSINLSSRIKNMFLDCYENPSHLKRMGLDFRMSENDLAHQQSLAANLADFTFRLASYRAWAMIEFEAFSNMPTFLAPILMYQKSYIVMKSFLTTSLFDNRTCSRCPEPTCYT